MEGIEKWLSERNLEPVLDEASGQYYTEYLDVVENVTYKVWIENEHSMVQRVALVHKYDLAGIASWRRGFEKPVIWDVIQNGLEQRLHTFEPVEPQ
jgi:spore germination protein YaaH